MHFLMHPHPPPPPSPNSGTVFAVSSEAVFVGCLTVAAERDIVLEVNEHIKQEVMADLMEWVCTICKLQSTLICIKVYIPDFESRKN